MSDPSVAVARPVILNGCASALGAIAHQAAREKLTWPEITYVWEIILHAATILGTAMPGAAAEPLDRVGNVRQLHPHHPDDTGEMGIAVAMLHRAADRIQRAAIAAAPQRPALPAAPDQRAA